MTKTLLIIEDDQSTVRLLTMALQRKNYEIQVANNGLAGLKMARAHPPDAILLDLMLPGVDGFEVLSRIRNLPEMSDIPVLVVSAKSSATDKERAADLGAQGYLQKPYRIQQLYTELETLVSKKQPAVETGPRYVLFVGPRPSEVATVVVRTGVALAQSIDHVTTIDLHPYAVKHPASLDLTPPSAPVPLGQVAPETLLEDHIVRHESGLTLLSNLAGSGDMGQPTGDDVRDILSAGEKDGHIMLVDAPLRPSDLLRDLAKDSALVVIVAEGHPATLSVTQRAVRLLREHGIPEKRLGFALIQNTETSAAELPDITVRTTLPKGLPLDHPAWQQLAQQIQVQLMGKP